MSNHVGDIRSKFIKYFVENGHTEVHSSPLIPRNDPTMMFVNSGMVQFKNVFTGLETRDYKKATSSQKSVRAGGKHNDLENVGYTARHHTFFEMLGNFSFGDYFKDDAIALAWELLTKEFGLNKDKLYATVYHTDDEAALIWKKVAGFCDDKIIRINTNDNFWSMGDTGPCGPCSEIFYDHGDHIKGGLPGTAEQDGDRYIEIWNMVFMQYEQVDKNTRIDLPKKSIDTGMGLERVAAVLQNVHDNYDIDLFKEIIEASEELTSTKSEGEARFSHRVIADHLRSSSFLIADGVMPSNEGRGYVLRRIMRRAMRHAHQLGAKEPLLYRMLPKLVSLMGEAYPELKRAESFVREILKSEEERFKVTLDRGLKLLEDESSSLSTGGKLAGDVAFKLYDTYGFPVDLTEDILRKREIEIDHARFEECMNDQRQRARASWSGSGDSKTDAIWFDIKQNFGATEFLGYSLEQSEAEIIALVKDGVSVKEALKGDNCIIITNQTPFYGESGGQMGDIGKISSTNSEIDVLDTKKYLGSIIGHVSKIKSGTIRLGDIVKLKYDKEYRNRLRANHSATHILHTVLRNVLGDHISQKGSLVASDKLRFDISHPKAITKEDIVRIEDLVNKVILGNSDVNTKIMSTEEAIKGGAMALFGEKYDNEVRVVSMGCFNEKDSYSVELCGGTHVSRTGDIGLFKITSEAAIAAGIRRIEATTGFGVLSLLRDSEEQIMQIADAIKSSKSEVYNKVLELSESKKLLEREISGFKVAALDMSDSDLEKSSTKIANIRLVVKILDEADPKSLRVVAEKLVDKHKDIAILFIAKNTGKISILAACGTEAASGSQNASSIVKFVSELLGGAGGGGNAKLAQAGAVDVSMITEVEKALVEFLKPA